MNRRAFSPASKDPNAWAPTASAPNAWLLGLTAAAVVLLSVGGESWQYALRYEREAVLTGQYWRLLTAHFVHGSTQHLLLNGAGLALIAVLFPRHLSTRGWVAVLGLSIVTIDIGLVLWEPQVHWYVGFSGVLHGALAAGAIGWWQRESKGLALILSIVLVTKLAWEQWHGALPLSGDMPVIIDAHLYGAIGGALAAAACWICARHWPWRA